MTATYPAVTIIGRRTMRRFLTSAAALLAASMASAQQLPDIPAPADVAAPPVEAVKTLSGLASRIVTPGTGTEKPQETDFVTAHYSGWTSEGRLFDSSHARSMPSMFALNRVMAGWRECVLMMTVGETRRCWVPQDLAFNGQAGRPTGLVVFDIELLDIRQTPSIPPPDVAAPPAGAASTPSGLYYKVIKVGMGTRHPTARDNVTVHYSGWTTAGELFDSTVVKGTPVTLDLNNVIRGWTEGLQLMVEGERTRFWVPEKLAYRGERGKPRGMLVFDIDLLRIEPPIKSRF
jgi:FKBP-type peptidyl-prolyl cis-trans isomerase